MPDPPSANLIAVDWGSTNFRATLLSDGETINRVESSDGIKNVADSRFETVLEQRCGDWLREYPGSKVVLSGMIGSREGWVEVPYVDTPASPGDLLANLTILETPSLGNIFIVPGVRQENPDGTFDVMRGEESQVFGLLRLLGLKDTTICAPGTHSKWIACQSGRIESFRTWATGETFQLLSQNSLLFGEASPESIRPESEAFIRGLEHSGRSGGLLHHLFLGRTDSLMGKVGRDDLVMLLSGLLVGHELREALKDIEGIVHLIAGDAVAPVYEAAFRWFGHPFARCESDVHPNGVAAIEAAG